MNIELKKMKRKKEKKIMLQNFVFVLFQNILIFLKNNGKKIWNDRTSKWKGETCFKDLILFFNSPLFQNNLESDKKYWRLKRRRKTMRKERKEEKNNIQHYNQEIFNLKFFKE